MKKANDVVWRNLSVMPIIRLCSASQLLRVPLLLSKQTVPSTSSAVEDHRCTKSEIDMHLWPSATIRDSFKLDYLRKLEWNLERMKSEKESQKSVKQKLLDGQDGGAAKQLDSPQGEVNGKASDLTNSKALGRERLVAGLCRETLMLLSCCFCCGACADEEADLIF